MTEGSRLPAARGTRRPRIFIGLTEIADYYAQLQAGLEELGYDTVFVSLAPHPFYSSPSRGRVPAVARLASKAEARAARSSGRRRALSTCWRLAALSLRLPLLLWAIATREIFIFGFASSFFAYRELPLLKLLGKRVIYIFNGSDSRPPYLNGSLRGSAPWREPDWFIRSTRQTKRRVATIDRSADVVVDNPLSAHLHERPVVSFTAIGVPRRPLPETRRAAREPVRVLHSPSNPVAKGSEAIRAAVDRLRARGLPIELVELSGVSHDRVLEELREVDLVVDQLYSDVALAGFAAEAAAAGVPVVVCGYGREAIEEALCGRPLPPVVFCRPDELEPSLERLATDAELRRDLGRSGRSFVKRELSPRDVAQRLLDAVDGRRPEWMFDPHRISYVHGAGLDEAAARKLVRATIERGGVGALCVGDKPELEQRLLEFAARKDGEAV